MQCGSQNPKEGVPEKEILRSFSTPEDFMMDLDKSVI